MFFDTYAFEDLLEMLMSWELLELLVNDMGRRGKMMSEQQQATGCYAPRPWVLL